MSTNPADIVSFWREAGPERWWNKSADFDSEIRTRFGSLVEPAVAGKLDGWADTAEGALALIIVLDQFRRNLFRNDPRAFAGDAHARAIADLATGRGFDGLVPKGMRFLFYMPFMHSERMEDQERCVAFFQRHPDPPDQLESALMHHGIIARFGRFPHRNAVLGRRTTAEEQAFLDGGGFAG